MATTAAEIQELYIAYFGRPADPSGLQYWVGVADQQGILKTANFFGTTPEFQSRIGSLSTEQAINTFYINLFGRQADAAGLLFWTNKVQTGVFSIEDAGFYIANNTSPADASILANKVTSADLWTADINTTDAILTYNTQEGQAAGISFLTGVTSTAATEADTEAAVNQMVADSGGSEAGVTFNQISANAVLTSNVNTNNNQGPGFSPSGKFLTNASDTVVLNGLGGAFVQDINSTDRDIAKLQAAAGANALIGIEDIQFVGAGNFAVNTLQGVKTVEFNNFAGQQLNAFDQAQTATVTLNSKSQAVTLQAGAVLSAINVVVGDANQGTLNLGGGFNASAITFTVGGSAVSQFSFNANASRIRTLNIAAGSAQTSTLRFDVAYTGAAFTAGGFVSAGGDFILGMGSGASGFFQTAGNVFSFQNNGVSTISLNAQGNAATLQSQQLTVVSGLDQLYIANTQGGAATISATIGVTNNAFTLSFQSAFLSAAFTSNVAANAILLSAQGVSGASDVLNLSFASFSNFNLLAGAVVASGFETLNLNIFNANNGSFAVSGAFSALGASTFNLVANAGGVVTLGSGGTTGITTYGLSQADGGISLNVSTAMNSGVQVAAVMGASADVIDLRNIASTATMGDVLSQNIANINTIDISDGGADTIVLGFTANSQNVVATTAGLYKRASIVGFGVGDVLSFTGQFADVSANSIVTVASLTAVSAAVGSGVIVNFFDGTDTLVFFSGTAFSANDTTAASLAAVLRGTNVAAAARWNLNNQGALQLIA